MYMQLVSGNNIDNLLMYESFRKEKLMLLHTPAQQQALSRYRKKLEQLFEDLEIATQVYRSLEELPGLVKALRPSQFQFNDLKIAESLAVISALDPQMTEIFFYRSAQSDSVRYGEGKLTVEERETNLFSVSDYVQLAGGDIETVNDEVFDRLIKDGSFDLIIQDPVRWRTYSRAFVDTNIVTENASRPLYFTVKFNRVTRRFDRHFRHYVAHFVERGYFKKIAENEDRTVFRFMDLSVKSFFKLSGSWLELITYHAVRSLGMDDVDASVLFTWNKRIKHYENEIDLLATKNGKLLVISCKDTKKVNKEYLNEIVVNSQNLAHDNVLTALVTTSHLMNESFYARANELDIAIVPFENDFEAFKTEIGQILD